MFLFRSLWEGYLVTLVLTYCVIIQRSYLPRGKNPVSLHHLIAPTGCKLKLALQNALN